jgi:flagellar biosynthetic protein FliR
VAQLVSLLGPGWIIATLLLAARIAAVLLLTPVLHAVPIPPLVRVLAILGIACLLAMPLAGTVAPVIHDTGALLQAMVREVLVGATLGLGVLMGFAGFTLAGRLVDVQVGYGMAGVLDPLTRTHVPVLSSAFGLLAAVFFFVVDGHHALLRGLAYSLERFPVGRSADLASAGGPLAKELAALFALGFALAAPVVLTLLLVDFALGVISRNLPQMNMLVMGIPVKIIVGLLALSVWAGGFGAPAGRLYAQIYQAWTGWFAAEGARR